MKDASSCSSLCIRSHILDSIIVMVVCCLVTISSEWVVVLLLFMTATEYTREMCFTSRKKIVSRVYTALQNYIEDFQLFFFKIVHPLWFWAPIIYHTVPYCNWYDGVCSTCSPSYFTSRNILCSRTRGCVIFTLYIVTSHIWQFHLPIVQQILFFIMGVLFNSERAITYNRLFPLHPYMVQLFQRE